MPNQKLKNYNVNSETGITLSQQEDEQTPSRTVFLRMAMLGARFLQNSQLNGQFFLQKDRREPKSENNWMFWYQNETVPNIVLHMYFTTRMKICPQVWRNTLLHK